MYFHRDDASSREFYNGTKSKNNAKGEINLRNIVGVREASKGKYQGIVVESNWCHHLGRWYDDMPRGRSQCVYKWLNALRDIIGKLNRERYDVHRIVNIVET